MIVNHIDPVVLVGGGKLDSKDITRALEIGKLVIAADGGANACVNYGIIPDTVIGDFDSISTETRNALPDDSLHKIDEQDSTDFEKCLLHSSSPLFLCVGFAGARMDHHLAVINALVRYPDKRCIVLGENDIFFLAPPSFALDLDPRTRVSLFPLGAVEGVSDGLEWPINGLSFTPDGQVGTSNRATGPISLSFTAPKMLMILPNHCFETTAQALLATTPTWQGS